MKIIYLLAFGLLGHFAVLAQAPVYSATYTMQLKGQRYYAYPGVQVCGADFAQSDDERTLPAVLGGDGGWNSGNQSFTSTAIPSNMTVKTVAVTVNFNTQVEAPVTLKLNGVPAATIWSQAGILRDGCQTATFALPVAAYVNGGLNTVHMSIGANAVLAVSTETVTITYSANKNTANEPNSGLVQICHKGDPIYVAASAVAAHQAHGDSLGDCTSTTTAKAAPDAAASLMASPNPAADQVAFTFRVAGSGKAELQVYNQWGKLVAAVPTRVSAAGELQVVPFNTQQLPEGLYVCRLVSSAGVQTTRLTLSR
ncbi:hypothetical protein GCM10027594_12090 [Hymenobacter agri]